MLTCAIHFLSITHVLSQQSSILSKFQQSDYEITPELFELVNYDKRYVKQMSIVNFKYNRTSPAVNASFMANVDFGNDLEIVAQTYKFLSNEYRHFPLRFQINVCDAIARNAIGTADYKKCGNFTGCPIKKDKLFIFCNWRVDASRFPPLIPNGRYMVELQGVFHGVNTGLVRISGKVERPILPP